jgi:hypothetical protein
MQSSLRRFMFLVVVLLTVSIATSRPVGAADALWSVPGQAAAGMYLQDWSQFLWGLLASQTGTFPTWEDAVEQADGSSTARFWADDGTEGRMTWFPDNSSLIEMDLPDGTSQTILMESPISDPDEIVTINMFHIRSSDGFARDYTRVFDSGEITWDASDDWMQYSGAGVLPNGLRQSFTVTATGGRAEVESTQSDGSTYTMSVPLDPFAALPRMLPDFTKVASGTYTDPTTAMEFSLTSTPTFPGRWAALLTDVEGGVAGTLSLNEDFSAVGQLEADGMLAALVCWTHDGDVQVCDLTGQNVQMGPAGAALDFLRYRWQTLTALNAPVSSASSPSTWSRRPSRRPRVPFGPWHRGMRTAPSGRPPMGAGRTPGLQ